MNDEQYYRVHGIDNPREIAIARPAEQVWQAVGVEPDMAVMACGEEDARIKLARLGHTGEMKRIK
jgi:hypothetical protein